MSYPSISPSATVVLQIQYFFLSDCTACTKVICYFSLNSFLQVLAISNLSNFLLDWYIVYPETLCLLKLPISGFREVSKQRSYTTELL